MRPLIHTIAAVLTALTAGAAVAEEETDFNLDLPPLDWNGAVTYSLTQGRPPGGGGSARSQGVTTTLQGSTYIYAPWLVGVTGNVNLTKGIDSPSAGGGSSTLGVTGGMTIGILPRSQYPIEISYSRFDSSVSVGEELSETSGDTLRLQSRVFLSEKLRVSSNLTAASTRSDDGFVESYKEADVSVNKVFTKDDINLRVTYRDREFTRPDGSAENGKAAGLTWRWRSQPFLDVTTDSVTSIHHSTLQSSRYDERNLVMQGVSTALWRPKELPDLTVHGALRTYSQNGTLQAGEAATRLQSAYQTAFADLTASYLVAPRLVATFGFDGGYEDLKQKMQQTVAGAPKRSSLRFGSRSGLNYTSVSKPLLGFDWNWSSSASANARTGTLGFQHSESIGFSHSAHRQLELPFFEQAFSLSVSQGLGTSYSDVGYGLSLNHSLSLGRSMRDGKDWDYIQASITDTRSFGTRANEGQLLHFQFTRGYDPDRFTTVSGSITYQIARLQSSTGEAINSDSVSGNVSFRQFNLFGIERLSFTSDLALSPPSFFKSERSYYSYYSREQEQEQKFGSQRWTNRLDYVIGKLRTSLIGRITNTPAGLGESAVLQISRAF